MDNVMEHCSRCGKELTDMRIFTSLALSVERKKTNDIWEEIPNLDQVSKEVLCKDCFDEFADLLAQMNTSKDPATQGSLNQTQLNPLHKDRQTARTQEDLDTLYEERLKKERENKNSLSQEELDRQYEERLAQEGVQKRESTQPDRLTKTSSPPSNPAEALRQEVAREKEQEKELARPEFFGDTSQIDEDLGSVPPEKQAELDRQFAKDTPQPAPSEDELYDPVLGKITPERKAELDKRQAEREANGVSQEATNQNDPRGPGSFDPGREDRIKNAKTPGDLVRTVTDVTYK